VLSQRRAALKLAGDPAKLALDLGDAAARVGREESAQSLRALSKIRRPGSL
jgi:hypothetical protein